MPRERKKEERKKKTSTGVVVVVATESSLIHVIRNNVTKRCDFEILKEKPKVLSFRFRRES